MSRAASLALAAVAVCLSGGCGGSFVPPTPPDVEAGLKRASALVKRGKLDQARAMADSIRAGHPRDWSVHLAVFRMWVEKQRLSEAGDVGLEIVMRRAEMTQPRPLAPREVAAVALLVSQALWSSGRMGDGAKALDVAIRADSRNAGAANELAYHLAEQERDLPKALRLAKLAVKLAPREGYIVDTLGWVYFKMGRISQAREWLAKAVALDPDSAELRAHLSRAELASGSLPAAYVEMRKALALSPALPEARALRAEIIRRYNPPGPL